MPLEITQLVLLCLLGGWVAADGTSVGQFMVSRPLVAATLAGWVMGAPAAGAAIGLVLEVFYLTVLPVGAARYPEGGPPAVVSGAIFAASDQSAATLLTILVFFLIWEEVAGATMRAMRRMNGRLMVSEGSLIRSERQLERRHLAAIGLDLLRGIVLVAAGLPMLQLTLAATTETTGSFSEPAGLALQLAMIALLAGSARLFGRRIKYLAAGAAAGLLLVLLRS